MNPIERLHGVRFQIETEYPRYTLPPDVPPPTGMTREDFAAWSKETCGCMPSILPDNAMLCLPTGVMVVNRRTFEEMKASLPGAKQ
jgi:hypothetical protein